MAKGLFFDLGSHSAGPAGAVAPDARILSLAGAEISVRADQVLAVVDGDSAVTTEIHGALTKAFCRGSAADAMIPGEEGNYVSRVLSQLPAKSDDASVALALRLGHEVVVGCTGGASVYIFRDGALTNLTPDVDPQNGQIATGRAPISPSDCLVLLGHEVSTKVEEKELRQTVQASFSVEDAAAWLVTLAAGRGGHDASAIVAQVQSSKAPKVHFAETGAPPPRRPSLHAVNPKMISLAAAGIAALIVAFIAASTLARPSGSATSLLPATNFLVSHPSGATVLSWGAAPGATGYVVKINGSTYATKGIIYTVPGLSPGKSYPWQVKTIYGNQSRWSAPQVLTVPLAPPLSSPKVLSPGKTVSGAHAHNVYFCWASQTSIKSYDLKLSGGHQKYNRTPLPSSTLRRGKHGGTCYSQSLPPATAYSWQLGASTSGHREAWTAWQHFTLLPIPTPTPAATQQYPVYSSTPVPTTAVSYPTGYGSTTNGSTSSGGTTYQPPTTSQQTPSQPSTSSSGSSAPAQPAPTSPVSACANPPNC